MPLNCVSHNGDGKSTGGMGNQAHVELMVSDLVIVEVLVYMFEGGEAAILREVHSWTCD